MADSFQIQYATEAIEDLALLRTNDRVSIRGEIVRHLSHEPTKQSRSRIKRMVQPFWSEYRLRVGEFRVYYDVDRLIRSVAVLRILEKGTSSAPLDPP